ncbi:MAG: sigma-70 family RNA polymerase sigma factor [Gemmatimonadota bacterium]|nr:MAG: sigma-70 family RNA polymerase sigma factor [Gemmatimonadota bacterium]
MNSPDEITERLRAAGEGDREALDEVFAVVYDELHRRAHAQRRRWVGNDTLDTTALVHEAYLKLVDQSQARWSDRAHFLAVASKVMRHVLVNYAEQWQALKRGGGVKKVPLDEANPIGEDVAEEILALHESLDRLAEVNERHARVVEARFFAGLPIDETAAALGISPATVKRDWKLATAWLQRELKTTLIDDRDDA